MRHYYEKLLVFVREKNIISKIISLFLAFLLWAYLHNARTERVSFDLPITYKNLSGDQIVSYSSDDTVTVTLDGRKELLENIDTESLAVYADIQRPRLNEAWTYPLRVERPQVPDSVNLSLSREGVELVVEKLEVRSVQVMPDFAGEIKEGYISGIPEIEPEIVKVSGASSGINGIEYVYTEPLNISQLDSDLNVTVHLLPTERGINLSENRVRVRMPVVNMDSLYFLDIPLKIPESGVDFEHFFSAENIRVYLKKGNRRKFEPDDIMIIIDVASIEREMKKNRTKRKESVLRVDPEPVREGDSLEILNLIPDNITVISEYIGG